MKSIPFQFEECFTNARARDKEKSTAAILKEIRKSELGQFFSKETVRVRVLDFFRLCVNVNKFISTACVLLPPVTVSFFQVIVARRSKTKSEFSPSTSFCSVSSN